MTISLTSSHYGKNKKENFSNSIYYPYNLSIDIVEDKRVL